MLTVYVIILYYTIQKNIFFFRNVNRIMVFVIFVSFFLLCHIVLFIALFFFQKWSQIMCIRASKVQWRYLFAFLSIVPASFRYIFVCMCALLYMLIANKWIIFKSKVELHSNYWLVDAVPTLFVHSTVESTPIVSLLNLLLILLKWQ